MSTAKTQLDKITRFYRDYYENEIATLAQRYPAGQNSLSIDFQDVYQCDMDLADDLREHPDRTLEAFEEALARYDVPIEVDLSGASVRVGNLPETAEYDVGSYRVDNIGQYLTVAGQVQKKTEVKFRPQLLAFECQRCGTITRIPQSGTENQAPHECQGCERQGPFRVDQSKSDYLDYQQIRLQQPPEKTKSGDGADVDVHIEGDLVGDVEAGDRVNISGIMYLDDEDVENNLAFDPYIDGRDVEVEESDYEDIDIEDHLDDIQSIATGQRGDPYELLIQSIAPKVQGMGEIKEALVLQLFGGVRKETPGGETTRGNSHILTLGDPGTAKSKLLNAVSEIAPRGVFASGKGASAAGMTAAAVQDDFGDNAWTLEAGALVVANNGLACVDEIDKVDEDAINSMHTALEQEKVHVNKAGINTHLPTRTALLAAGNPKQGRFDPNVAYADQIDLDPAMISRFDLMFMVDDEPDRDRDAMIGGGVLEHHQISGRYVADHESVTEAEKAEIAPAIDVQTLRAYIAHAKKSVTPILTDDVVETIRDWYVDVRNMYDDWSQAPVPVTARKIEGAIRLAEASARVRLSQSVEHEDWERAKRLILRSMRDVGMDPETGQFDADIVETGTSTSQRDRLDSLKDQIRLLEEEGGKAVPEDEIIDWALENNRGKNQTIHDLKKLKKTGDIYEPEGDGQYRVA